MRHIAAYLLLQIGGNASPSAADIKKVLGAVGIEADDERLEKLISELGEKDVNEVRDLSYSRLCILSYLSIVDRRGLVEVRLRTLWWCRRCHALVPHRLPQPVVHLRKPRRRRRRKRR